MLNTNQIADLDAALDDLKNKKLILDTGIDVQAILRLLVDKGITTKEEVQKYRDEVKASPKWNAAALYVEQTLAEIKAYQNDPQLRLKAMFAQKMNGGNSK